MPNLLPVKLTPISYNNNIIVLSEIEFVNKYFRSNNGDVNRKLCFEYIEFNVNSIADIQIKIENGENSIVLLLYRLIHQIKQIKNAFYLDTREMKIFIFDAPNNNKIVIEFTGLKEQDEINIYAMNTPKEDQQIPEFL